MTFLKLDLNTKTWDQPITFEVSSETIIVLYFIGQLPNMEVSTTRTTLQNCKIMMEVNGSHGKTPAFSSAAEVSPTQCSCSMRARDHLYLAIMSCWHLPNLETWTWTAKPCHGATKMFCGGTKDAIYHGPTLKFSSVHGTPHNSITHTLQMQFYSKLISCIDDPRELLRILLRTWSLVPCRELLAAWKNKPWIFFLP